MRATGLAGLLVVLAAVGIAGCADLQAIFAPSPPPPARRAPAPPPPVLSPELGRADEERLRQEADSKLRRVEQILQRLDEKELAREQHETFSAVQSFLAKAKEALSAQDFLRASNLADKAQVLAEELSRVRK